MAKRSLAQISAAVGLSAPTLRKHYGPELADARSLLKGELAVMLLAKARDGSIGAMRRLEQLAAEDDEPAAAPAARKAADKLGKKAARDAAAQTAHEGTGWDGLVH
ncbi:MAG TPA: hypothetical protein VGG29_20880 [Caulobacteraceae bacterium]